MSLWSKNLSEVTFADVNAFCQTMQPEGARLDYKGISFPNDLAKTIAAFANTLGGLIILGVDADKIKNMPIWPPSQGLPTDAGYSERIGSLAQQAIYPPVRVEVSNVITNEHVAGTCVVVIRVNQSREAPHAVEKRRKIYVYERTENTSEPHELADVARIEQLLARRQRIVDQREAELQTNLARGKKQMTESLTAIRWMSASPVYPWRDVCTRRECATFHQGWMNPPWKGTVHWRYQTFPGGSFARGIEIRQGKPGVCACISSVFANGTLFCMTYADETLLDNQTLFHEVGITREQPNPMWVNLRRYREMARDVFEGLSKFYKAANQLSGEIIISVGMSNALGVLMQDSIAGKKSDALFPDSEYRIDRVFDSELILKNDKTVIEAMFEDIAFDFNAHAVLL